MSSTHIPPQDSPPVKSPVKTLDPPSAETSIAEGRGGDLYDPGHWEQAYRRRPMLDAPALLIQLQDDLARSRRREAFWISVIVHILILFGVGNYSYVLRFFPHRRVVQISAQDLAKQRDLTFLELPPDAQKITKRPETDIVSDKDRTATHSMPLDPNELKKILDAARQGEPGKLAAPAPPDPSQQPNQQVTQNQPTEQPPARDAAIPQRDQNQTTQLPTPVSPKVAFGGSMTAGSAIEQAARAAAANRNGYGGAEGDYGLTRGRQGGAASNLDVLSDTMGVDFGPYLARVVHDVRENWYLLIPEIARAPIMKKGKVSIQFAILKDGRVAGMRVSDGSGDVSLDRAAWGGITNSNPFPPLPAEFKGEYLELRFHFFYNPEGSELR